jgi:hypothetical protein
VWCKWFLWRSVTLCCWCKVVIFWGSVSLKGGSTHLCWRWRLQIPVKYVCLSIKLHGGNSRNVIVKLSVFGRQTDGITVWLCCRTVSLLFLYRDLATERLNVYECLQ